MNNPLNLICTSFSDVHLQLQFLSAIIYNNLLILWNIWDQNSSDRAERLDKHLAYKCLKRGWNTRCHKNEFYVYFMCYCCHFPPLIFRHIAAECTAMTLCWNCKEPGHMASECSNEPVCHNCNKTGHLARDCSGSGLSSFDTRLCNNCHRPGHIAADCTNDKACNNCRKPGHLARECPNDPVCNLCNVSGHMARQCLKSSLASEIHGGPIRDIICRTCNQPGHISRDCVGIVICNTCGGRGHMSYECPSSRMLDRGMLRRYWWRTPWLWDGRKQQTRSFCVWGSLRIFVLWSLLVLDSFYLPGKMFPLERHLLLLDILDIWCCLAVIQSWRSVSCVCLVFTVYARGWANRMGLHRLISDQAYVCWFGLLLLVLVSFIVDI